MSISKSMEGAIAVTRFGMGARPGELSSASDAPREWLKSQISREGGEQPGPLPPSAERYQAFAEYLRQVGILKKDGTISDQTTPSSNTPMTEEQGNAIQEERKRLLQPLLDGVRDEIFARTRLAASTGTSFRERWTLFWSNHFTVSTVKIQSAVLAGAFEREAIRPNVFGRFEDLLVASSTHPGMLVYLDQERSAGPNSLAGEFRHMGLNENLAREIMELHTVGADAGYTQADVTEFARALTGYSIGGPRDPFDRQGRFLYRPQLHEPGARSVMGRTYAQEGKGQARAILADLAASPRTAEHIAKKLAIHFVADDPPRELVGRLRDSFVRSGGDLSRLAETLIDSREAWDQDPRKFKTPYEFVVSG